MILKGNEKIKRLAIYFFYDKDGIVDDYIPYMLNDLKKYYGAFDCMQWKTYA